MLYDSYSTSTASTPEFDTKIKSTILCSFLNQFDFRMMYTLCVGSLTLSVISF